MVSEVIPRMLFFAALTAKSSPFSIFRNRIIGPTIIGSPPKSPLTLGPRILPA